MEPALLNLRVDLDFVFKYENIFRYTIRSSLVVYKVKISDCLPKLPVNNSVDRIRLALQFYTIHIEHASIRTNAINNGDNFLQVGDLISRLSGTQHHRHFEIPNNIRCINNVFILGAFFTNSDLCFAGHSRFGLYDCICWSMDAVG